MIDDNAQNNSELDTILDNAENISSIISVFNPIAGLIAKLATTALKTLNNSDTDNLKEYYGLEKIATTLEDIESGKIDKKELLVIANEIRSINKAIAQFHNLIS